jgi:hypothetical protein
VCLLDSDENHGGSGKGALFPAPGANNDVVELQAVVVVVVVSNYGMGPEGMCICHMVKDGSVVDLQGKWCVGMDGIQNDP